MKNTENTLPALQETAISALPTYDNLSFDKSGFEDSSVTFFDPSGMEGIEMACILTKKVEITIKDEIKEFIVAKVLMSEGYSTYHFGQRQVVNAFDRANEGKGVQAFVTFLGKIALKGTSKTMNDFKILTKTI